MCPISFYRKGFDEKFDGPNKKGADHPDWVVGAFKLRHLKGPKINA
jgi:hypothetical protein